MLRNFGPGPRVSVSSVSPHLHSLIDSCISLSFSMSFRSWAVSFPVDDWGLHPKASGHFVLLFLLSPACSFYWVPSARSPIWQEWQGLANSSGHFSITIQAPHFLLQKEFPRVPQWIRQLTEGLGSSANETAAEFGKTRDISVLTLFYRK